MSHTSHNCSDDQKDQCVSCPPTGGPPVPAPQQEQVLDQDIAKLNQDLKTYESGWRRALADYQNLQKELVAERQRMAEWSTEEILLELIPLADHFDDALNHGQSQNLSTAFLEGLRHIRRELEELFSRHGITSFGALGDQFNSTQYESVGTEVGPPAQEGQVAKVAAHGYKRGERVLRPARVVIFTNEQDKQNQ